MTGDLDSMGVAEIRQGILEGAFSARQVIEWHLDRIDRFDGPINSVPEPNRDAMAIADAIDGMRACGEQLGPLAGVPILLKDNIDTGDWMMTTSGSLALEGHHAARDAQLVARLRAAGAVILGKVNLAEWANFRALNSTRGWSSRGGLTRNPYALERTPGGSSSGSAAATAAAFCTISIATETDGSVVSPAALNGVVGIKPTVGLVSRHGIIPISYSQDTAGVMARTVADAAAVLTALAGTHDEDPATREADSRRSDYVRCLDPASLSGMRIGIAPDLASFHEGAARILDECAALMRDAGAETIEVEVVPIGAVRDAEYEALVIEYKQALGAYLAALPPHMPVRSLEALVAFNRANRDRVMPWFGQDLLERAVTAVSMEDEHYKDLRRHCLETLREQGIERAMADHRLDAVATISTAPAWVIDLVSSDGLRPTSAYLAAIPGLPNITVPAGYLHGLPIGLSLMAGSWQEAKLIRLAYAFEQASRVRRPPQLPAVASILASATHPSHEHPTHGTLHHTS